MIAGSINATSERPATTAARISASYALYGLHVVSDIRLPVPVSDDQAARPTDLVINTICTDDAPLPMAVSSPGRPARLTARTRR